MTSAGTWILTLLVIASCKGSNEVKLRVDRELNMNVSSRREETGWTSTFTAKKESSMNSSAIDVDVTLKVSECQEKQTVLISGVLRESIPHFKIEEERVVIHPIEEERLIFHPNCGTNVVIGNGGRSITKLKEEEERYGTAITKRPLKDNEVFEVRLDKKTDKISFGIGIGVTSLDPKTLEIPSLMNVLKEGTWMFYDTNLHMNGTLIRKGYVSNLKDQKIGDRLGIKRTESGTLHLYFNGVDQGPAVSRVPRNTYGVYELQGNAVAATIVDASYP